MKKAICMIIALYCCTAFTTPHPGKPRPVIIAYVGGYRGLIAADSIDVWRLSHINYAFVDIKDNRAWLHNEKTDTINLRKLGDLKKINPGLKILISIGGWKWSKNFSDAVLTDTATHNFAASAVTIVSKYNLDGIDIDWEYPGMKGDSNVYRPEDKQHYTLLFKELRQGLDSLHSITHMKYFVTTAVGASQKYIDHTEMDKVQLYTDYINVMSYDYADGTDSISGHHTNLYVSSADTNQYSAHRSVQAFIAAGVPPSKIVMGIAFYGKGWQMQSADNNGLYRKTLKPARGGGYTYLKDSLVNKNGYREYWDSVAMAPYLFNAENNIFISYDNERSVRNKCDYVKKYHLAGAMFWEYSSDEKEYLLKIIAGSFKYAGKNN
ncbi:MAG: glycoside hydrolase family 18 protein [Chitinophagales bacterium]